MVKGMKAVKALWGLAHINNHIKILPPISFLIDRERRSLLRLKSTTVLNYYNFLLNWIT
jgi:hypothetical protein